MLELSGKTVSIEIRKELEPIVEQLKAKGINPGLALILVGEDEGSVKYVGLKAKRSRKAGVEPIEHYLKTNTKEQDVVDLIQKLNKDANVHGIMVQLPLPEHIDELKIVEAILPSKDVDGLGTTNMGRLVMGEDCFIPAGVYSITELLDRYDLPIDGKHVVIVGMSNIIGKPFAAHLMNRGACTTFCQKDQANLATFTKQADILVVDIEKKHGITKDMVKKGVVIMDNGNNYDDEGVHGDVAPDVSEIAHAQTPVPGGIGPLLIRLLIKNVIDAASKVQS
ncbi:MAG: bifunctional 5,10-methylenetetrahydrofolate dehydrogenase/5,10-methenyltetrahydrofolate cyclohydrolase [Candidatus Ranarchaeia archaeon]|jgi:methylenetetrahydrofolate dehydrogenase (NADP+)/methenyltetrahydrofolate cyclohydrolase